MSVVFSLNGGDLGRILSSNDSHLLFMCSPDLLHLLIKFFLSLYDLLYQRFLGRLHLLLNVLLLLLVTFSLCFSKFLLSTHLLLIELLMPAQMIIHQIL